MPFLGIPTSMSDLSHAGLVKGAYGGALEAAGALTGNKTATQLGHAITNPAISAMGGINPGYNASSPQVQSYYPGIAQTVGGQYYNQPKVGIPDVLKAPSQPTGGDSTYYGSGSSNYVYDPSTGTYSYGPVGPSYDPQQVAQYDQAIGNTQSAIDRLGNQFNIGSQNIDTGYQQALNPLNLQKDTTTRDYQNSKTQDQQQYRTSKNGILDNSNAALSSIMRLLGSRGAGGSSDYLQAAPGAVALQATQQRANAGQTYAQNEQGLDTNYNDFLTGYNNAVGNLGQQKDQQKQSLQATIDTNRASFLQTLAQLQGAKAAYTGGNYAQTAQPYLDQANGLLSTADSLGAIHPSFTPQTVAYRAPGLSSYNPGQFSAAQVQNPGSNLSGGLTPALSLLLGGNQDKKNLNNIGV